MYNLNHLLTFVKVADLGSFNKAAGQSYLSSAAIAKQINNLETELGGIELLKRSKRGIELTPSGKFLYGEAKKILNFCDESERQLKLIAFDNSNTVRFGVTYGIAMHLFEDVWDKVRRNAPDLNIELIEFENTWESNLKQSAEIGSNIDMLFGVLDSGIFDTETYCGHELMKVPLTATFNTFHPLAGKEIITLDDLANETLFIINEGWSDSIDAFREYVDNYRTDINVIRKDYYDAATYNQCARSNAILISVYNLSKRHPFLKTIPIDWSIKSSYGFIYSKEPSPAVQTLIKALED